MKNETLARVYGMYIGAKITLKSASDPNKQLFLNGQRLAHLQEFNQWEQCKLILRPLSALTDEDAVEVGKLYEYAGITTGWQKKHFLLVGKDFIEDTSINSLPLRISDFLRTRGYDLPCYLLDGKTLRESNLATYENE